MSISDHISWYSERHTLHIDLSSLINTPTTLILTSWNYPYGITWQLINDQEQIDEHYDDPFTAPYFPIWECLADNKACDDYLNQIPKAISDTLRQYRSDSFGMLMLLSQHKKLSKFYGKYCTPFWLLFRQAKYERWTQQQFVGVCESGVWNVFKALNLPANHSVLEMLNKLSLSYVYSQFHADLIQQTFQELDYQHLNRTLENVPDHLLQYLLRYPELQHAKLIRDLTQDDYSDFYECVKRLRYALMTLDVVNVNAQLATLLATSDTLDALKAYEKRVSDTISYSALHDYAKSADDALGDSTAIPQWICQREQQR